VQPVRRTRARQRRGDRDLLLDHLRRHVPDSEGHSGDIRWNFEKFLIAPDGTVTRFSPMVAPDAEPLVSAIEAALPS
jgi:glutathione peroxidase-family protein